LKKTLKVSLLLLGIIVLPGVILLGVAKFKALHPKEPVYQGQPLSVWLVEFEASVGKTDEEGAKDAIRHMGPEALSMLVEMAAFDSTDWKFSVRLWLEKWGLVAHTTTKDCENSMRAFEALWYIKADAYPVIPELVAKLGTVKREDSGIGELLCEMKGAAVPELKKALCESANDVLKRRAIKVLGQIGSPAVEVLPDLKMIRNDPKFQPQADLAIRSISPQLADELQIPKPKANSLKKNP
jgi:hypothetical protein